MHCFTVDPGVSTHPRASVASRALVSDVPASRITPVHGSLGASMMHLAPHRGPLNTESQARLFWAPENRSLCGQQSFMEPLVSGYSSASMRNSFVQHPDLARRLVIIQCT